MTSTLGGGRTGPPGKEKNGGGRIERMTSTPGGGRTGPPGTLAANGRIKLEQNR